MSDISREELVAFTEAHSKSALALQKITETLEGIARTQEKVMDRLGNGISEDIVQGINGNCNTAVKYITDTLSRIESDQKETLKDITDGLPKIIEDKLENSSVTRDISHVKWFIGITGTVVLVAMVILRIIGNNDFNRVSNMQTQVLQGIIQEQMKQDKVDSNGAK